MVGYQLYYTANTQTLALASQISYFSCEQFIIIHESVSLITMIKLI